MLNIQHGTCGDAYSGGSGTNRNARNEIGPNGRAQTLTRAAHTSESYEPSKRGVRPNFFRGFQFVVGNEI
eukprot:4827206-Lingulodinium_polyedra.AAC.1